MISFRNAVRGTNVTNWWDNGNNQVAFCRGNNGFIAFNGDTSDLNMKLQTCLPPGVYCDIISGTKSNDSCTGKTVSVDGNGLADIGIRVGDDDGVLAIHIE